MFQDEAIHRGTRSLCQFNTEYTDLAKVCNGYHCHQRVQHSKWDVKRSLATATHLDQYECEVGT